MHNFASYMLKSVSLREFSCSYLFLFFHFLFLVWRNFFSNWRYDCFYCLDLIQQKSYEEQSSDAIANLMNKLTQLERQIQSERIALIGVIFIILAFICMISADLFQLVRELIVFDYLFFFYSAYPSSSFFLLVMLNLVLFLPVA